MSSSDFSLDEDTSGGQNLIPERCGRHDIITCEYTLSSAKVALWSGRSSLRLKGTHITKYLDLQYNLIQTNTVKVPC